MVGFLSKLGVFLSVMNSGFEIFTDPFEIFNRTPQEIFHVEFYFIALITILCSVVSTFYYIRIVKILYFENTLVGKLYYPISNRKILILSLLLFLLVFLFINPTFLYLFIHLTFKHYFFRIIPR
jgi:NADH:ubiquinone oxidoreductase subunit 2 (subunit N)